MKTQDFRTAVPVSAKEKTLRRMKEAKKNTAADVPEEICPFTVEPFVVCRMKVIVGRKTPCPFSLEACIKEDV